MTRPIIKLHDLATDQIIEREMTTAEYKEYQITTDNYEARQAQAETQAQAKVAAEGKLAALGLTTDDLRALGL